MSSIISLILFVLFVLIVQAICAYSIVHSNSDITNGIISGLLIIFVLGSMYYCSFIWPKLK